MVTLKMRAREIELFKRYAIESFEKVYAPRFAFVFENFQALHSVVVVRREFYRDKSEREDESKKKYCFVHQFD